MINMIIGTKESCLTLVKNKNDDDTLLVLARSEKHIKSMFPDCDMFIHPYADLQYRAYIDRDDIIKKMRSLIADMEYTDFTDIRDVTLSSVYSTANKDCYVQFIDERVN